MNLSVCIVILLSFFVTSSFSSTSAGIFYDPKNPGKCTIRSDLILSPGDIVKNPHQDCGRILCGGRGYAEFHTCFLEYVPACVMGDYIDKSLPYPACCKRHVICN